MAPFLDVKGLTKSYGSILAVNEFSLQIEKGARHALVGRNGAGKSTILDLLSGHLRPSAGRVILEDRDISALAVWQRVQLGLCRGLQIDQQFAALTPLEMLAIPVNERMGVAGNWWQAVGKAAGVIEEILQLSHSLRLTEGLHESAAWLPRGKRRLLELALAIACRPRLLLLDEPAAGTTDRERGEIREMLAELPREMTLLIAEPDFDTVLPEVDRISVIENGGLVAVGPAAEIASRHSLTALGRSEGLHG
jgi:branched-chain amino acid transport system ATP-binding protein